MDKKLEKYINYVANSLFEDTIIDHYNKILKLPFYLSTTSIQFLIDIGYGDYSPRFLSDESIIKYLTSIYGIENNKIKKEVWNKYLKKLESNLLKNESVMINENTKKEKYFEIIISEILSDKSYSWRDFDAQTGGHKWGKINSGIEDVAKLYGIDSREDIKQLKNLFISEVLNLPKPNQRIRLIHMDDPYTNLVKGSEGTVKGYTNDPYGFVMDVKWDNKSGLSLIVGEDKWEVLS